MSMKAQQVLRFLAFKGPEIVEKQQNRKEKFGITVNCNDKCLCDIL